MGLNVSAPEVTDVQKESLLNSTKKAVVPFNKEYCKALSKFIDDDKEAEFEPLHKKAHKEAGRNTHYVGYYLNRIALDCNDIAEALVADIDAPGPVKNRVAKKTMKKLINTMFQEQVKAAGKAIYNKKHPKEGDAPAEGEEPPSVEGETSTTSTPDGEPVAPPTEEAVPQ